MSAILLVEDSPTQAAALVSLLEQAGYRCDVVPDGGRALETARAARFDLVISDVVMPGMTGFDLCRAFKRDALLRQTPFVLLTTLASPLDVMHGLAAGADNYITKPYEPELLLARVGRVLDVHRARRARAASDGVSVTFLGEQFRITSSKEQVLDVLLSSFEELARTNEALRVARHEADAARARAEEANLAKSEFLTMMSHDLRTPLNAIGGYADLISLGVRGPVTPAQVEDLDRIRRNQRHLLALVTDILSFARVERGEIPLHFARLGLNETLRPLGDTIAPQLRTKRLGYEYVPCDTAVHVDADRERLDQIVINLLGNAVKFTGEGGRIRLVCSTSGDTGCVAVEDSGVGIPPDKLDAIFEPFTQVDEGTGRVRDGVGLGLAISRELARRMGGDITVSSVEGRGSTFTLTLPLATGEPSPPAPPA